MYQILTYSLYVQDLLVIHRCNYPHFPVEEKDLEKLNNLPKAALVINNEPEFKPRNV